MGIDGARRHSKLADSCCRIASSSILLVLGPRPRTCQAKLAVKRVPVSPGIVTWEEIQEAGLTREGHASSFSFAGGRAYVALAMPADYTHCQRRALSTALSRFRNASSWERFHLRCVPSQAWRRRVGAPLTEAASGSVTQKSSQMLLGIRHLSRMSCSDLFASKKRAAESRR